MTIYFSPARVAFYSDELHGDALPDDALAITAARHRALMSGQSQGGRIIVGPDGHPHIQHPPKPTAAARRASLVRRVKREAARRIESVSPIWRQMNDMRDPSDAGAARFAALDAIRSASSVIEAEIALLKADNVDIADHPAWPGNPS